MPTTPFYDVVVIGAGIQGAGVAQAATAAGYTTLIIEKAPQAGMGTSCKSSKLIHGGLRYLESAQFKLVRECLHERKILLKNAPHLVALKPFYIPVYKHSSRPSWLIFIGLLIYSLFSFKSFSIIKKSQWPTLDGLNLKNLKTIFKYYDAQNDDKKLTQSVINSALKLGTHIEYNANLFKSKFNNHQHQLSYTKNNEQHYVNCNCIINCSGPWVELTQNKITPFLKMPKIELIAGTHIIINQPTSQGIFYLEAEDKRAIFVMPWKENTTLIGTTEKRFTSDPDKIKPSKDEISYLLKTYNQYFNAAFSTNDIIQSFAGLRVLPASDQSIFNKSRESLIIHSSQSKLITVIGGKLTAYRASSNEVIKTLKKLTPPTNDSTHINTENIALD